MNDQQVTCVWRVRGAVQGIGFRYHVSRSARELDLEGWVCNLSDGDVLLCVRGPEARVRRLRAAVNEGHPQARVDQFEELDEEPPQPPMNPFSILR
jgi:acylphosphatase